MVSYGVRFQVLFVYFSLSQCLIARKPELALNADKQILKQIKKTLGAPFGVGSPLSSPLTARRSSLRMSIAPLHSEAMAKESKGIF